MDHRGTREVSRTTDADVAVVDAVLSDGWTFAAWVVGASRVRAVDATWPAVGARIHHSFGAWPLVLDDVTTVVERDPGRRLVLQAEGWPLGEARIELTLTPADGGCRVAMREDAVAGPGLLVPRAVRQVAIVPRNAESLRRLCLLAEGR